MRKKTGYMWMYVKIFWPPALRECGAVVSDMIYLLGSLRCLVESTETGLSLSRVGEIIYESDEEIHSK